MFNGSCKFEDRCAYKHEESDAVKKIRNLEVKLEEALDRIESLEKSNAENKMEKEIALEDSTDDTRDHNICKETEVEQDYKCELCDFKSSWKTGFEIHMGRKHVKIPQFDGSVADNTIEEDDVYNRSEHYLKSQYLGTAYQAFLDAKQLFMESDLKEEEKEIEIEAIFEARKDALGTNFKLYPPWI